MRLKATKDLESDARVERQETPALFPSEATPLVFISSVMDAETEGYRKEAVEAVQKVANLQPWAFEFTSASSDGARSTYLQKVREAAIVIWLATKKTTGPVQDEVREALTIHNRLLVFKLYADGATPETESLLGDVQKHVKWCMPVNGDGALGEAVRVALCDEISQPFDSLVSVLSQMPPYPMNGVYRSLDVSSAGFRFKCRKMWPQPWLSILTSFRQSKTCRTSAL